ncbi:HEXXH motif-containing putative peptide modification protein [Amycolatopsis thermalba]|uniref:HEXXH motif-containing putative peptide modification protein n=1 Tax=Amycolatopsis thermalba TaxID=944492 RepID=A0ABY4P5P1_9PSEU|nr:HEXXH motif-containing putative peptide modification protein [Amycolatopsis thermalba]UQS27755.1 HEXXH motif-containing putative peptide modification protein [Amycolatopsis thermalba]
MRSGVAVISRGPQAGPSSGSRARMNSRSAWPDATAVHAALAPAHAVLEERRALYRLAVELLLPGRAPVPPEQLDSPLFRFQVGEALAGRRPITSDLGDDLDCVVTELVAGPSTLKVATGDRAGAVLAEALRVIHAQSLSGGRPPRVLTGDDEALAVVSAGLDKVRAVSPALADDLVAHVDLLVVLDPATSGGLVSASSRLFPGMILIDRPDAAYEVAEAIIHEGAHQKFFDLAITRDFLGPDPADGRTFRPSWSAAVWPVEQVIAAFHAYACLAQFAEDVWARNENSELGTNSLLPRARERATEIGRWLRGAEDTLEIDAKWLLRTLLCDEDAPTLSQPVTRPVPPGYYTLDPLLRIARMETTRRVLVGRPGDPPELHWLDGDAAELVVRLSRAPSGLSLAEIESGMRPVLAALFEATLVRATGAAGVPSSSDGSTRRKGN